MAPWPERIKKSDRPKTAKQHQATKTELLEQFTDFVFATISNPVHSDRMAFLRDEVDKIMSTMPAIEGEKPEGNAARQDALIRLSIRNLLEQNHGKEITKADPSVFFAAIPHNLEGMVAKGYIPGSNDTDVGRQ